MDGDIDLCLMYGLSLTFLAHKWLLLCLCPTLTKRCVLFVDQKTEAKRHQLTYCMPYPIILGPFVLLTRFQIYFYCSVSLQADLFFICIPKSPGQVPHLYVTVELRDEMTNLYFLSDMPHDRFRIPMAFLV